MYSLLTVTIISLATLFFLRNKITNWPNAWANTIITFLITLILTMLASIILTKPSFSEYPLVKSNNVYFSKTSDKYGTTFYNYLFKTNDQLISRATTHFKLTDSFKVVIIQQQCIIGDWGFPFLSATKVEYEVHIPKDNTDIITQ